jgi:hypothetical protein
LEITNKQLSTRHQAATNHQPRIPSDLETEDMASETNKPPSNPSPSNNNNTSNHDEADLAKVSGTQNFPETHIDHRERTSEQKE